MKARDRAENESYVKNQPVPAGQTSWLGWVGSYERGDQVSRCSRRILLSLLTGNKRRGSDVFGW